MDDTKAIERELFLKIENEILKIKVTVNSIKLKELASDICDNCSVIKHIEKRYIDEDFNFEDKRRYRNLETNIVNGKFGGKYGLELSFRHEKNKYDYLLKRISDIEKQICEISNDNSISNSIKIKKLYILSSKLSELCDVDAKIPDKNITDYYDSILECFSVDIVEIMSSENINSIFNYLDFLNKDELDSYMVDVKSMDPIFSTWLIGEIKKSKQKNKIKCLEKD